MARKMKLGYSVKSLPQFGDSGVGRALTKLSYGLFGLQPLPGVPGVSISNYTPIYAPEYGADDLLIPQDLQTLRKLYTYFYEQDEIVGQAIDIHTEIPLSRFVLLPPKTLTEEGEQLVPTIMLLFNEMVDRLDFLEYLIRLTHHYWLYGEAFPYHEVNEETGVIENIVLLDPDLIYTERKVIGGELKVYLDFSEFRGDSEELEEFGGSLDEAVRSVFGEEGYKEYKESNRVPLNTDPKKGSFVYPFLRTRSGNDTRGSSILRRVLRTLIYRDQLRSVQSIFMQRNMMSVHLVTVEPGDAGITDEDVDTLTELVNQGINTPDFALVVDRPVTWEIIRGYDRVPDFTAEYDQTTERLMIGLGLTPEILKGEGLYSSGRISLEILNLRYQLYIAQVRKYLEDKVFRPIAERKGFVEHVQTKKGDEIPVVLYPRVSFSRTTLYDSESTFEMLWNMYLQGVVSLHRIMEILSIDYDIEMDLLADEFGSIASPSFHDLMSNLANTLADKVANNTTLFDLVVEKLQERGIEVEKSVEEEGDEEGFGGPGFFPTREEERPLFEEESPGEEAPPEEEEGGEVAPSPPEEMVEEEEVESPPETPPTAPEEGEV